MKKPELHLEFAHPLRQIPVWLPVDLFSGFRFLVELKLEKDIVFDVTQQPLSCLKVLHVDVRVRRPKVTFLNRLFRRCPVLQNLSIYGVLPFWVDNNVDYKREVIESRGSSDNTLWVEEMREKGLLPTIHIYFLKHLAPHHCNGLVLHGFSDRIPERVSCFDCRYLSVNANKLQELIALNTNYMHRMEGQIEMKHVALLLPQNSSARNLSLLAAPPSRIVPPCRPLSSAVPETSSTSNALENFQIRPLQPPNSESKFVFHKESFQLPRTKLNQPIEMLPDLEDPPWDGCDFRDKDRAPCYAVSGDSPIFSRIFSLFPANM
ncbi:hypothetical protein COLO4_16359 [Corchorus olitorius]|uniref:Sieve element occlusion C-terminal domain-containing protein n=1 Tax=Corchorus olitorius TaxID=93759 RepID=A0A1R3JHQ3_9ROSI|nr:hypothetical protein COLO4_16359 [Corchorus olitorius]